MALQFIVDGVISLLTFVGHLMMGLAESGMPGFHIVAHRYTCRSLLKLLLVGGLLLDCFVNGCIVV